MTPFTLPRRIRLVRLLRARGFRDAERLREDELVRALDRLDTLTHQMTGRRGAGSSPSSSELVKSPPAGASSPLPTVDPRSLFEDPDALPRFREPRIVLPEGERTFLRLVAVDSARLFATWDLDAAARAAIAKHGVRLELHVLDEGHAPSSHEIDARAGGWYLDAPGPRLSCVVRLVTTKGEVLAESNPAIVLADGPAGPGPIVFATLPPSVDRRLLVGASLLTGEGVPHAIGRVDHGEGEGLVLDDGSEGSPPFSAEHARRRFGRGPSFSSIGRQEHAPRPSPSPSPSSHTVVERSAP